MGGGGVREGSSFGVPVWETTEREGVGSLSVVLKTRFCGVINVKCYMIMFD